jgi:serine/threonine-protein kinase
VGAVLVLALAAAGVAVAGTVKGDTVAVPSLVGLTSKAATDRATAAGLSLRIVLRNADDPKDTVIAQDPAPGSYTADGSELELVVSRGPPPVAVPEVVGKSVADATAALQAAGFLVQQETPYDETVPAGDVIGTTPKAPATAPRDSTVKLLVSNGPAPVTVPDVAKQSYDQAAAALTGEGFTVTRADVFDPAIPKDQVVGTSPAAGTAAPRGSQVTISVSKGPELVAVPSLVGKSLDAATAQLQGLGFVVDTQSYLPGRVVRATDPAAGTQVPKGTKVTLFF